LGRESEQTKIRGFTCPTCGKRFRASFAMKEEYPHLPFCSEKCKMVDLGAWFDEEYRISDPLPGAIGDGEGTREDVKDNDEGGGDSG